MFGSGSVTCVTSLCPAGTVGLGGPGDNAGSLFALLQASRAAAGVSSICALGLGDSRRCRQVPPRSFSGTLLTLCPGLWGGRSECDKGGLLVAGYCSWLRPWPLFSTSAPFALPLLRSFSYPRSDLTEAAEPGTHFLFLRVGQG